MPTPTSNESEQDFVSRCIPIVIRDDGVDQKQAAGKCYGIYRNAHKSMHPVGKAMQPISAQELTTGAAHEAQEHGFDAQTAVKVAMDHLKEHPRYYTELKNAGLM